MILLWFSSTDAWVLLLTAVTVLWKGGKSLESTWLLVPLAVLCAFVARRRTPGRDPVPASVWWSLAAFLALSILSYVHSSARNYGLDELLRDGSLLIVFFWVVRRSAGDSPLAVSFRNAFLRVLAGVTVLACAVGAVVYALQPVNRFVGTFFDHRFQTDYWPNAWAEYLLLAWPAVLWWVWQAHGRRSFTARSAMLGAVLGCLVLSYSRGGMMAAVLQLLVLGFLEAVLVLRSGLIPDRRSLATLGTGLGSAALALLIAFGGLNAVRARFHAVQDLGAKVTFTADEGNSSITERSDFFAQAWSLSLERPWLGWGPYAFRFVQPRLERGVLATSDHPHNVLLKLAMERGWPAAAAYSLFLFAVLLPVFLKLLRRRERPAAPDPLPLLFASACGVLAHNMIDYNLQFVGIALPFTVVLGLLAAAPVREEDGKGGPGAFVARVSLEFLLAVLLLLVVALESRPLIDSSRGRRAEAAGDHALALQWYGRAVGQRFSRDMHLSVAHLQIDAHEYDKALEAAAVYRALNPEDPRGWKAQAEAQMFAGDLRAAAASYARAYELGKYNDVGMLRGLLETARRLKDRSIVDARRAEIDGLLETVVTAIEKNTHFIALSSNVEEFAMVSDLMRNYFPKDVAKYDAWKDRVLTHATRVRQEISARPPGYLW